MLPTRIAYTDHLVLLVARSEAAGARIAGGDPDRRDAVAQEARRDAARLSARLDGSPLDDASADAVERGELAVPIATGVARRVENGGWARALRLEGMPTHEVAAVEYANLLACADAEPKVARRLFEEPLDALGRLHGLVCGGLVDPALIGRPRRTAQAVMDGAQGMIVFNAVPPAQLDTCLGALAEWLGARSAAFPALVVAGVVHERLLEWQPFEAGNGRVARAFARVVLRARGLDPDALAVPERAFAADPVGYYGEVAATMRRRGDVTRWLERWGSALVAALEAAATAVAPGTYPPPPPLATAAASALAPGATITVPEYAVRRGCRTEQAVAELHALGRAGLLEEVVGTSGLRYRRPVAGCPIGQGRPGNAGTAVVQD